MTLCECAEERAAILEFDAAILEHAAGYTRDEAERMALERWRESRYCDECTMETENGND